MLDDNYTPYVDTSDIAHACSWNASNDAVRIPTSISKQMVKSGFVMSSHDTVPI